MKKIESGISLLEILVVVSIFAFLGILITRSVLLTIGGGKKSESLISVRENLNYSLGIIERNLRNANSIVGCGDSTTSISYTDTDGNSGTFSCGTGYIASGSARLSNNAVNVTSCSITCVMNAGNPSSITIDLEATSASASGLENSTVTATTQILLRNY